MARSSIRGGRSSVPRQGKRDADDTAKCLAIRHTIREIERFDNGVDDKLKGFFTINHETLEANCVSYCCLDNAYDANG